MSKLLSPAGDEQTVYAAFEAGADAVYVGVGSWSRRSDEFELTDTQLEQCLRYANQRGKEIRLVVNTYYRSSVLPEIIDKMRILTKQGLHHLIVTDLGLIKALHSHFPDLHLTVSVSAAVTNVESVNFLKDIGAAEVVLPTNYPIDQVRVIQENSNMAVEVFIHGHVDYLMCGHCWMSTYFHQEKGNYGLGSLNRGGSCFRVCMVNWKNNGPRPLNQSHSPQMKPQHHFYGLDKIAEYIDMGVTTLKIKGRTYNAAFVGAITRFYRDIIDEAKAKGPAFVVTDAMREQARLIEHERVKQAGKRTGKVLRYVPWVDEEVVV